MSEHLIELHPGEKIISEVRRHMFVFYYQMAVFIVLIFLPIFVSKFVISGVNTHTDFSGLLVFLFLYSLWLVIFWTIFFLRWTDYYLDVWVITNERVFDIEQKGMFTREISSFRLEQIQDVNVEIKGIIATFLRFGDVYIHTAGEKTDFVIKSAAHPLALKRMIMDQQAQAKR